MLDLAYVRENLTQVEEMLRRRGMDPQSVLSGFRQVDEKRRQLITQSETLKAQRNRASEEIAKLKKAGQDATAQMEQTKALRAQSDELEKQAGEIDQEMRTMLAGIPNVPHESVPVGRSADDNKEVRKWGKPPEFSFTPKPHWELGEQLGVLDMERAVKLTRRAVCRLLGPGRKAGAGAGQLHARSAYERARLYGSAYALHGEFSVNVRHGTIAEVRQRPVQDR